MEDTEKIERYKEQYRNSHKSCTYCKWIKAVGWREIILQCKVTLQVVRFPRFKAYTCSYYEVDMREEVKEETKKVAPPPK